jgi:hypothetical protein
VPCAVGRGIVGDARPILLLLRPKHDQLLPLLLLLLLLLLAVQRLQLLLHLRVQLLKLLLLLQLQQLLLLEVLALLLWKQRRPPQSKHLLQLLATVLQQLPLPRYL